MKNKYLVGNSVVRTSLILATTLLTSTALRADEHETKAGAANTPGGEYHADAASMMTVEKFVQKTLVDGNAEVEMARLGEQQAQNAEVKALAAAIMKDHSEANKKLQQIAASKNVTASKDEPKNKHRQQLEKLKSQSGAEFDKEFVRVVLKHHKQSIAEFEKAQTRLDDLELKGFVSEVLPKLRQHQQMAQSAAKAVGVDEASIAADLEADADTAAGAAPVSESGSLENKESDNSRLERPRSSIDSTSDIHANGTINPNDPSPKAQDRVNDLSLNANTDVEASEVEPVKENKVFQKGDGKVLGLSTDKNDGKFLGIIPNPRADDDQDAAIEADVNVDANSSAVGSSATVETGNSKKDK